MRIASVLSIGPEASVRFPERVFASLPSRFYDAGLLSGIRRHFFASAMHPAQSVDESRNSLNCGASSLTNPKFAYHCFRSIACRNKAAFARLTAVRFR